MASQSLGRFRLEPTITDVAKRKKKIVRKRPVRTAPKRSGRKRPERKRPARKPHARASTSHIDATAQARRLEAMQFWIRGATCEQIATTLGITRQRVWQLITEEVRARGAECHEIGDVIRNAMTERYQRVIKRLWELVYPAEGGIDLHALDRLGHVDDRLSRIYGIYEPQRMVLDIRAADNMVMTAANISLRYIPEQNREAFVAEIKALVDQVTREHEAKAGLAVIGRIG